MRERLLIRFCDCSGNKYKLLKFRTNPITEWNQNQITDQLCSRDNGNDDGPTILKSTSIMKRLVLTIDGIEAFYLFRELEQFTAFRRLLCRNPALSEMELLWVQPLPPQRDIIDMKWYRMLSHSIWEKIEVEYLMSWLSTLGGGFSALGEQFSKCAETAGKISLKQLSIGIRLGDPFLQARCRLYYSISLIQTGQLRKAKYIVRQQYRFAKQYIETDSRLVNMCRGIWFRIQYEYEQRIQLKQRTTKVIM